MARYRKKPVVIEAVQWTGDNWKEIDEFITVRHMTYPKDGYITIPTLEGMMQADKGDYIIKEPFATKDRKFYPCKPDIFEQTYERVDDDAG